MSETEPQTPPPKPREVDTPYALEAAIIKGRVEGGTHPGRATKEPHGIDLGENKE